MIILQQKSREQSAKIKNKRGDQKKNQRGAMAKQPNDKTANHLWKKTKKRKSQKWPQLDMTPKGSIIAHRRLGGRAELLMNQPWVVFYWLQQQHYTANNRWVGVPPGWQSARAAHEAEGRGIGGGAGGAGAPPPLNCFLLITTTTLYYQQPGGLTPLLINIDDYFYFSKKMEIY